MTALKWTRETPTLSGWYWYRANRAQKPRIVRQNVKWRRVVGPLWQLYPVDSDSGEEWAGPIPEPETIDED